MLECVAAQGSSPEHRVGGELSTQWSSHNVLIEMENPHQRLWRSLYWFLQTGPFNAERETNQGCFMQSSADILHFLSGSSMFLEIKLSNSSKLLE